jgi:hypothetical protein
LIRTAASILTFGCFDMNDEQQTFLEDVSFSTALNGTVQRGKVYRPGSTEAQKRVFRAALRQHLKSFIRQYQRRISEGQHLKNIDNLTTTLSKGKPAEALNEGRFRIGSAQKALNLYLKMLWCLDRIPMPPHCPFDSVVLSRVPGCGKIRWTQLDDLSEYAGIVACAKVEAHGVPLAEWELSLYSAAQLARR